MIHFFPRFTNDATDSPFGREIAATGVEHRLLAEKVSLQYRSRLWLVFVGWPRIAGLAFRAARRSMVVSRPRPDAVVLNYHIEVLAFGLFRAVRAAWRRATGRGDAPRTLIALVGFIHTDRRHAWARALRRTYFRVVFGFADVVMCHSKLEVEACRTRFAGTNARFVYLPYGLSVAGRDTVSSAPAQPPYVFAAGRSGRDYRTLIDAVRGQPVRLRIACDRSEALAGIAVPDNTTVLRDCYGSDYIRELAGASVVVVPLEFDDISAGQMVMLQAMAFGKPVIVTRTSTITDYASHDREVFMVPRGDALALRSAIGELLAAPARLAALGRAGLDRYETQFSMRSYVRNIVAIVGPPPARGGAEA